MTSVKKTSGYHQNDIWIGTLASTLKNNYTLVFEIFYKLADEKP